VTKRGPRQTEPPARISFIYQPASARVPPAPYPRNLLSVPNLYAGGSTTYVRLPAPRPNRQTPVELDTPRPHFTSLHFSSSQHPTTNFTTFSSQSIRIPYSPSHHIPPSTCPHVHTCHISESTPASLTCLIETTSHSCVWNC
jgi:hypothetical protein